MTNVIGSLHSSGLIALIDAAGLAAIIGACEAEEDFTGIVPLGAVASLDFRAPARGRLVASCRLAPSALRILEPLLAGTTDRARITTGENRCRGSSGDPHKVVADDDLACESLVG